MGHRIATSLCWSAPFSDTAFPNIEVPDPVALYVAFLDPQGNPNVFQQMPGEGVWTGPFPLSAPLGIAFTSIAGVNNYFVALGSDGNLYAAVFYQVGAILGDPNVQPVDSVPQVTDWSAFQALPPLGDPPVINSGGTVAINDFAVVPLSNATNGNYSFALLIVAAVNSTSQGVAGFYSYTLNMLAAGATPKFLPIQNSPYWNPNSIGVGVSALQVGGASAPALAVLYQGLNPNPTIVFIGVPPLVDGTNATPISWTSGDGVNWVQGNLETIISQSGFDPSIAPSTILLTLGNPYPTLQAILVTAGQPQLFWSSDGSNWLYFGDLMPPNSPSPGVVPGDVDNPPTFNAVAAGFGNDGNLQVIGLGPDVFYGSSAPFLVWQASNGAWALYPYDKYSDGYLSLVNGFLELNNVVPTDLAVALGWCNGGRALQVLYLGSDSNVYVTWQDTFGGWHWYPGLSGNGLP